MVYGKRTVRGGGGGLSVGNISLLGADSRVGGSDKYAGDAGIAVMRLRQ